MPTSDPGSHCPRSVGRSPRGRHSIVFICPQRTARVGVSGRRPGGAGPGSTMAELGFSETGGQNLGPKDCATGLVGDPQLADALAGPERDKFDGVHLPDLRRPGGPAGPA